MGSAAVRWGDPNMFRLAMRRARAREPRGSSRRHGGRWLTHRPPRCSTARRSTGSCAGRTLRRAPSSPTSSTASSTRLEASFAEAGDSDGQPSPSPWVPTWPTHAVTCDVSWRSPIASRALPGAAEDPLLQFFVGTYDAALAALSGDLDGSLRTIESMSLDQVPPPVRELVIRLHVVMLVLAGRAEEAVPIGRSLRESSNVFVRSIPSMLRWAAGDPSEYLAAAARRNRFPLSIAPTASGVPPTARSSRRRSVIVRSPTPSAERSRPTIGRPIRATAPSPRPSACCKILDHDEDGRHVADRRAPRPSPTGRRRGEAHLRHNLAIAYIASATVREHWDDAALGPCTPRARAVARLFLAARDGRLDRRTELASPVDGR